VDRDLYGRRLEVQFVEKIRDEANFSNLDALKAQMSRDAGRARSILGTPAS
jgi:riboflavin kinase/FMN adenylyltransferase